MIHIRDIAQQRVYFYFCLFSSLLRGEEGDKKTQKPERKKNTFQKTLNSFFWISLLERGTIRSDVRHTNPFYTPLYTLIRVSRAYIYNNTSKEGGVVQIRKKKGFRAFPSAHHRPHQTTKQLLPSVRRRRLCFFCLGQVERTRRNALRQSSRRRRHPILFALLLLPKKATTTTL